MVVARINMKITGMTPFLEGSVCHIRLGWVNPQDAFSFTTGQFATLSLPGEEKGAYFAIASSPEEKEYVEFLVKKTAGISEQLVQLKPGNPVTVEGPLGKGFPLDQFKGKHLLLIGVGTGIAPLRSVFRSIVRRRSDFRYVHLYYGALTPAHFFYRDEIRELRKKDIQVILTATTGDGDWAGRTGFVQAHLEEAIPDPAKSIAFLVGMKEMVEQTRGELIRLGLKPDQILLNF